MSHLSFSFLSFTSIPDFVNPDVLLPDQRTHFALAFELPGGWHKEKEAVVLTVLEVWILKFFSNFMCL